jgi:outer membrane protein W
MRMLIAAFTLFTLPLFAQRPPIEAGVQQVIGFYGSTDFDRGRLELPTSHGFAATAEVFWMPAITTHFAATFVNPEAFLNTGGETDLGTVGITIASTEARYHFRPSARFDPYAGAGIAYASLGNIEDRFGDALEATLESRITWTAAAGVRYRVLPRLTLEAGATYVPMRPELQVRKTNAPLPASLQIDALIVRMGATSRF